MKSYTNYLTQIARDLNKTGDTNFTPISSSWLNDGIRIAIGTSTNWKFLESTITTTTTAGTSVYFLPYNYDKLISVKILVGTYQYVVGIIKSRNEWNKVTSVVYQSDYPMYCYLNDRTIEFFPTPSTTGNTISIYYKKRVVDLQHVDYVTGSVTATNGSATIAGAGTTFTPSMVGRYFKVNDDGNWYLITGFTNATTISIEQPYQGLTVAGAPYTIGEMSVLPENDDMIPILYVNSQYWYQNDDIQRASVYEKRFKEGIKNLEDENINSSMDVGLRPEVPIINPNFYPQSLS